MSAAFCPGPDQIAGVAHDVLASVGCNSQQLALRGYAALTAPTSILPTALTVCLTIYVGLLGFGLLTGSGGLRLAEVSRTGLKIGAILALTLNWSAFQTLVFNVALGAPQEVGRIFDDRGGPAGEDPLTRLEAVHQELTDSAASLQPPAPRGGATGSAYAQTNVPPAARTLYVLATTLIVCTVGLIALAMVAQAVLVALGPAFMLCFLFEASRGLFVGWLRALAAAIVAPITSWGGLMACLATMEPWVERLAQERAAHAISFDTISQLTTFTIIFAAAQVALALGAVVVAAAIRLPRRRPEREAAPAGAQTPPAAPLAVSEARAASTRVQQLAQGLRSDRQTSSVEDIRRLETAGVARASSGVDATPPIPRLGDNFRRMAPAGRSAPPSGAGGLA